MFCWEVEKHIEDHLVTCFQNEKIGHKTAIFPVLQNLTHMCASMFMRHYYAAPSIARYEIGQLSVMFSECIVAT